MRRSPSSPSSPLSLSSSPSSVVCHVQAPTIALVFAMLFLLFLPSPITIIAHSSSYSPSTLLKSLLNPTSPTTADSPDTFMALSSLPRCKHVVLVTAARHGSTWMLDNVERCAFSTLRNGTDFGRCNLFSELWMSSHKGPLLNISVEHALDYIGSVMSVKIFPLVWAFHQHSVMTLLLRLHETYSLPIVVLRRNLTDAYKSQKRARLRKKWNANVVPQQLKDARNSDGDDGDDDDDGVNDGIGSSETKSDTEINGKAVDDFVRDRDQYFNQVMSFMGNHSIPFDVIRYEEVRHLDVIELPLAKCHIINCNSSLR